MIVVLNATTDDEQSAGYVFGNYLLNNGLDKEAIEYDGFILLGVRDDDVVRVLVISGGQSGVIFHPRSGALKLLPYQVYTAGQFGTEVETRKMTGVAGGWANGDTELTTEYIYPLVDADNASFVATAIDAGSFSDNLGNYGNLYWSNGADKVEDLIILSWKGTPTRHFRLPSSIDIPGFSRFETSTPGAWEDTPQYTAFSTALYRGGKILADAPQYSWPYNDGVDGRCLILGAMQNADGTVYAVTQNDHYNAPAPLPKPGFYLGIWSYLGGWTLIKEHSYSRNGLPWFGNVSGTKFVCSNGDTLSIDGTLVYYAATLGTYKETNNGHRAVDMSFEAAYQGKNYFEFKMDELLSSAVNCSFNATSSLLATTSKYKTHDGIFAVYLKDTPATLRITSGNYAGGTATGGEQPYKWTLPAGSCGIGTLRVTDACGAMATLKVALPTGVWVVSSPRCCINYTDVPESIKPYVFCDEYNCYGRCIDNVAGTRDCWDAWSGSGWTYAGVCNSCGPESATTHVGYVWVCP